MIALDTNLLVRLLTDDDPVQAATVERLLAARASPDDPAFVERIVLVELVWVLQRRYGYDRGAIADAVAALLRTAWLRLENQARVIDALGLYRTSRADFADIMIMLGAREAGCMGVATFDRKAAELDGVFLVATD
jgi:predicted nucleic-acid-binding protein